MAGDTDLDVVLSLHVPEEHPHVFQCLFGVFALQPNMCRPITKVMTEEQRLKVNTCEYIVLTFKDKPQ